MENDTVVTEKSNAKRIGKYLVKGAAATAVIVGGVLLVGKVRSNGDGNVNATN